MSRRKACTQCGARSVPGTTRCPKHPLEPNPRGNAYEPTRMAVAERDGWICQICAKPITSRAALHIDHEIPRALGGTSHPANLRATHADCNLRKGDR